METTLGLLEAARRTAQEPLLEGERLPDALVRHLDSVSIERNQPELRDIAGRLAVTTTLLDSEAPLETRTPLVQETFNTSRDRIVSRAALLGVGFDAEQAKDRSLGASTQMVQGVVEIAAAYPQRTDTKELKQTFQDVFARGETTEDKVVQAYVLSDLLAPYAVNRFLQLDLRDPRHLSEQLGEIRTDIGRLTLFFRAIAPSIDISMHGSEGSSYTEQQVAEQLFAIGPIFTKIGQSMTGVAESMSDPVAAEFLKKVGVALQEGVAEPTEAQLAEIIDNLPGSLSFEKTISSASVAHVLEVTADNGERYATKVLRPDIRDAITRNTEILRLVSDVFGDYIEAHAGENELVGLLGTVREALPFGLQVLETDVLHELELLEERAAQKRARTALARQPAIIVPEVMDEFSDASHLTMRIEPAEKVADLPAEPKRIRNLLTFGLQSWHKRLLHGDLHGGNLKSRQNGDLVVYDWAKPIELSPRLAVNMARLVLAAAVRRPRAIARAYLRVQSPDHTQVTFDEGKAVAKDLIQELKERSASRDIRKNKLLQNFLMAMGIRHQSTIDMRYKGLATTLAAYESVLKAELYKPEYEDKAYRRRVLAKAVLGAFKDVYLPGRRKRS